MDKIYNLLIGSCCLIILITVILIYGFSLASEVNFNVDGVSRTIYIQGKPFQIICKESGGLWMAKVMGMTEFRNGSSVGIEKCSGCMPDTMNMFCRQNEYLDYIKKNGINTSDMDMGEMK